MRPISVPALENLSLSLAKRARVEKGNPSSLLEYNPGSII
jgi:hypothetical protein